LFGGLGALKWGWSGLFIGTDLIFIEANFHFNERSEIFQNSADLIKNLEVEIDQ
jgi:hypothetical protein